MYMYAPLQSCMHNTGVAAVRHCSLQYVWCKTLLNSTQINLTTLFLIKRQISTSADVCTGTRKNHMLYFVAHLMATL